MANSVKKKILLLGASGFIGSNTYDSLQNDYVVYTVSKKKIFNKNHFQLDLEKDNLTKLGKIKFNFIINASGYVDHNLNNSEKILKNHFLPIRNLFRTLNMNYIEKIIHIGSGNEYGEQKKIINENACCVPKSIYGFAKLMSTRYIENFCKQNKIPYIILRVFLAYGNNQKKNRLIPQVINNLNIKKKIIINNPNNIRNFCHIDDITNAINISIKKNIKNKIINIGFKKNYKIINVVKKITKLLKCKKKSVIINKNSNKNCENYKIIPSIKRAKLLLKWDPKINLEDGIKKTIQYIKR